MSASLKSLRIEAGNLLQAGKAAEAAPVSDMELVEKVKRGDRQAFSELVRRHQRGLLRLVLRRAMSTAPYGVHVIHEPGQAIWCTAPTPVTFGW